MSVISVVSPESALEPLEKHNQPFNSALADYQAAVLEHDRLRVVTDNQWSPSLSQARLRELKAWIAFKRLAWDRLDP